MPADVTSRRPPPAGQERGEPRQRKPFHEQYAEWKPPQPLARKSKEWFSAEEFEELKRLGRVNLSDAARRNISDAISLAASDAQFLGDNGRNRISAALRDVKSLEKSLATLARQLRAVEVASIPGRHRSFLESWRATLPGVQLPTEYYELGPIAVRLLSSLQSHAGSIAKELRQKKIGAPGAPSKAEHLDLLIRHLAEAYAREGGVPSAAHQERLGRRETPFLRVLRFVHRRLPTSKQTFPEADLDERAHRVIRDMSRWRRYVGMPSWKEQRQARGKTGAA